MAWHTDGCSTAPLTDFMNNPVAQELKDKEDYFSDDSDERIYIDLRNSNGYTHKLEKLKKCVSKKNEVNNLEIYKR